MAVFSKIPMYSKVKAGQIIFTTSQIWTVPRGVKKVDVFLVGGAGGGGIGYVKVTTSDAFRSDSSGGGGGGGGYTNTYLDVDVTPNSLANIIVGKGGIIGNDGNPSSFGALSADGGKAGQNGMSETAVNGGNGGSGGGGGNAHKDIYPLGGGDGYISIDISAGAGGTNGSNGGDSYDKLGDRYLDKGGIGQLTTTKAFGETNGTLYSSGGAGSAIWEKSWDGYNLWHGTGGNGSTTSDGNDGIVIVRWEEQ